VTLTCPTCRHRSSGTSRRRAAWAKAAAPSVRRSRRAPRRGPRAAGHGEPGLSARTAGRVGPVRG
jgi:hypothetical protein